MPSYQAEGFDPPAPIARTTIRGLTGLAQTNVPMLLDTGSDISIVPKSAAEAVGASPEPVESRLVFYDGTNVPAEEARLTVELLNFRFHGQFVLADADYGVLGRNILNRLTITFDGPSLTWTV